MGAWTTARLALVTEILGQYDQVCDALPYLWEALGLQFSRHALLRAFDDAGLGAPSDWLRGGKKWLIEREDGPLTERQPRSRFSSAIERIGLIPDVHIPAEDPIAFDLAIQGLTEFQPDTLVILGDFGDFESMSSHGKNPARMDHLCDEIAAVNRGLDRIQAIGAKRIIYCFGNHEHRVARYVAQRAPELYGELDLVKRLRLRERGIEFVPYGDFTRIGKLIVTHDVDHAGSNAAQRSRDEFNGNVAIGHCHNANISYRGDVYGDSHVGFACGWLGSRESITYQKKGKVARNWQHGFGIAYVERDTGNCHVHFVPILGGRCVIEGQIVQAAA